METHSQEENSGATPWQWIDPESIPPRSPDQREKYEAQLAEPNGFDLEIADALLARFPLWAAAMAAQASGNGDATQPTTAVRATPFTLRDPSLIPPREWLYGKHYVRRFLTATFGAGGGGKSAHAVSEAMAMATGKWIMGEPPKRTARVWYVNAEDPVEEIERRFTAAATHFNVTGDDLADRLYTDSGREQSFVVAREAGRETQIVEPLVAGLIAEIKARGIDVLIVDPFVSTHEVSENDNARIQRVAEQWVRVAEEANCAVELIHHTRKGDGEKTADDGRGAGALVAKARSVRVINHMTPTQAEQAGLRANEASNYFRVEFSKTNLAPRGALPQWRQFVGVPLGNGGTGNLASLRGDEIGVAAPWEWPSSDALVEDVTPEQFEAIKARIAGGDSRADIRAKNWAGHHVGDILGIETDIKEEKQRVKRMLDAWIEEGHFKVVERLGADRHECKFIDVAGLRES